MDEDDLELLGEFRTECEEHLDKLEPILLELESAGDDAPNDLIHTAFRALHSVKGAAGFLDLNVIQKLSHGMESLLMQVRDGVQPYRDEMTDTLLKGLDKLQRMVGALPETLELEIAEDLEKLEALVLKDGETPESKAAAQVATAPPTEAPVPALPTNSFQMPEDLSIEGIEAAWGWVKGLPESQVMQLELSQVQKIDSSGVQLLLALHMHQRSHAFEVRWQGIPEPVSELIAALGLEELIQSN